MYNNVMMMKNKQDKEITKKNAYKEFSGTHTLAERVIAGISE